LVRLESRSNANTANPSKTYSFFPAEPDWLFCLSSGKAEAKKIHQKSSCLGALVAEYLPIFEILPAP